MLCLLQILLLLASRLFPILLLVLLCCCLLRRSTGTARISAAPRGSRCTWSTSERRVPYHTIHPSMHAYIHTCIHTYIHTYTILPDLGASISERLAGYGLKASGATPRAGGPEYSGLQVVDLLRRPWRRSAKALNRRAYLPTYLHTYIDTRGHGLGPHVASLSRPRWLAMPVSVKKHSSREENPWEDKPSECQIRGWKQFPHLDCRAKAYLKGVFISQTPVWCFHSSTRNCHQSSAQMYPLELMSVFCQRDRSYTMILYYNVL